MKNNVFKRKSTGSEYSQSIVQMNKLAEKDIAIIGIGCRIADASNVAEYWDMLQSGGDRVRELSAQRKRDAERYIQLLNQEKRFPSMRWSKAGYLTDIAGFDYKFFNISPREAALMDPNQRIFLETIWQAIEDAGYGEDIVGSQTGVYVGYSSDFGQMYKDMIESVSSEFGEIALAGNIKSIIASRISYLLDLKGPSLVVDTACSSSLAAVYLACQDIRNGKCQMALAGGVKLNNFPAFSSVLRDIGIHSSVDKARSFDDSSDGTSFGEGAGVVMLKALHRAVLDGDQIYAVIKGGAMNQDGASINLTAPNMLAQQDVIMEAWKDAQIDPTTITYIEAHGTGTSLGDPIEIQAISNAFRAYTERKQFCAVSTVKTNVGHLDHAAGIAGLIKSALSLKHKKLVASLHFQSPNRKIDFADSAVYVNTELKDWNEEVRRCGVSSFGLSGTNVHLILEEGPEQRTKANRNENQNLFLVMSAKNRSSLEQLVLAYSDFLVHETCDLGDLCYTASVGRAHHSCRVMLLFNSKEQLIIQLEWLKRQQMKQDAAQGIYSNVHEPRKSVTSDNASGLVVEWLSSGDPAVLHKIAEEYVSGATVPWRRMYEGTQHRRISIPTYPFLPNRAWFTDVIHQQPSAIRRVVDSIDRSIFQMDISVERHWFISEHIVDGDYMLPGAAMLHLVKEAFAKDKAQGVVIQDFVIAYPFIVDEGEPRTLQIVLKETGSFIVCSKTEEGWIIHAEGMISKSVAPPLEQVNVAELLQGMDKSEFTTFDISNKSVQTGGRWNNVDSVYTGSDEVCLYLKLPETYVGDMEDFFIHPSLMDNAVHVAMLSEDDTLYLPWMYREIQIYRRMPASFYSYIRKVDSNAETVTVDITWMDNQGNIIAQISEYCMKKVHRQVQSTIDSYLHEIAWSECLEESSESEQSQETIVLLHMAQVQRSNELKRMLQQRGHRVVELLLGKADIDESDDCYVITNVERDLYEVFGKLARYRIDRIIHATGYHDIALSQDNFGEMQNNTLFSLFHTLKAMLEKKINLPLELDIVASFANEVTTTEPYIHSLHAALSGLGKSISQEYPDIRTRFIDADSTTSCERITQELFMSKSQYQVAFRDGKKYREQVVRLSVDRTEEQELPIVDNGTYLITGGLGGLGLATAQYLAAKCAVNLILLNRTPLPPRNCWHDEEYANDPRMAAVSKSLAEIEEMGSTVELHHIDIANEQQLTEVYRKIKTKHSRIDGIFHCAGVAGDGYLIRKPFEQFNEVVSPKIQGTFLLNQVTAEDKPDFLVLFSSVTAIFAGAGQGDYAAANMFLDAFAASNTKADRRTISINWPAWKYIGMAHRYGITDDRGVFMDIVPENAMLVLDRILRSPHLHRVVVGQYNNKLLQTEYQDLLIELCDAPKQPQRRQVRKDAPNTTTTSVRSGGPEQVITVVASLWTQVLGEAEYNADDNFFDVGGNSIIATSLLRKLQSEYPGTVNITDVFTYPTINEMSRYISSKLGLLTDEPKNDESSDSQLDDLLDQLINGEINIDAAFRRI
ncbi:type I polyketide synthase [Paenibacillus xylaniclasticus]|uniref:type I polyketide synthase n=1 Tax=Paenibacillus xylaniclasticus TaxID=588083 RepID=UPI000FD8A71F|nr:MULTISPECIES: type I polyketide synthase [Paenibacillus]GFN30896.1 hypothetical protein PCURB6_11560 [Paenibacillus curdlanolyticus]